jgi:EXLDI family protein
MPNKTIYVADDDLPLFERAQELSGTNLSSAIVQALRRFVEVAEAGQRGLDEITIIVNSDGAHRRRRFLGQRLLRWLQSTSDGNGTVITSVYRTARKRYAIHTRTIPNWKYAWGDPEQVADPNNWGVGKGLLQKMLSWGFDWDSFKESGDYSFEVYDTLEELKGKIPDTLYPAVAHAMEGPDIQDLDI